jgi:hypothetical protein
VNESSVCILCDTYLGTWIYHMSNVTHGTCRQEEYSAPVDCGRTKPIESIYCISITTFSHFLENILVIIFHKISQTCHTLNTTVSRSKLVLHLERVALSRPFGMCDPLSAAGVVLRRWRWRYQSVWRRRRLWKVHGTPCGWYCWKKTVARRENE